MPRKFAFSIADEFGEELVVLQEKSRTIRFGDCEPIQLTEMEYMLALALMEAEGVPVSKSELIERVWGSTRYATPDMLKHLIKRLRKKVGPERIQSIYGYGYRIVG